MVLNLLFFLSHKDMHKNSKQCFHQSEVLFLSLIRCFIKIEDISLTFCSDSRKKKERWLKLSIETQACIWKFCFDTVDMEIHVYMCLRHAKKKNSPSALAWQPLKPWETSTQRVFYQYIWKWAGNTSPLDLHLLLVWQLWVNVWASRQWANMMGSSSMQINEIW